MAFQIFLRGFTGAPIGSQRRKLPDDERFDVGFGRFFIVTIGAYIADVRIGETDNLPGVAGIGENFLIAGEAGVKNDFATTADASARSAAAKDPPVFERENRATFGVLLQLILQRSSF